VNLQSTSTADPRYEKIAQDFEQFGPESFKTTMARARAKLLKG
jgi:catalase (peroxidase I)